MDLRLFDQHFEIYGDDGVASLVLARRVRGQLVSRFQ